MVSFTVIAAFVAQAAAIGINCRGSSACSLNDAKISDLVAQVQQIQDQGNGNRHYKPGVQIACTQGTLASNCAFYQHGDGGSTDHALELLQDLVDHKCTSCGSVPTTPGNDVSKGELTVNVVSSPCCSGNCICPL